MIAATPSLQFDKNETLLALALFLAEGQVTELRCLGTSYKGREDVTVGGFFDSLVKLTEHASKLMATGTYFVPNPIRRDLLSRCCNRVKLQPKGGGTSDVDINQRVWLKIDVDPARPAGISSTNDEHDAAIQMARDIEEFLAMEGWPAGILIDSGNGGHVLYRINLPIDDGGIEKRCLEAISQRFSTHELKIDTGVFNPARIWKLPGSVARKGDNTPERPHRVSRILSSPWTWFSDVPVVDIELLERLANTVATPDVTPAGRPAATQSTMNGKSFDVAGFISRNNLDASEPSAWDTGGARWTLNTSPMCEHHDGAAYIAQKANGALTAGCLHDSCRNKWTWKELREKFEPKRDDNGKSHKKKSKEDERSQADILVDMALARYKFGQSMSGETFAVPKQGPQIATMLKGSRDSLRATLAKEYRKQYDKVPSATALVDALTALVGISMDEAPVELHLRAARHGDAIYIDLGDELGHVAKVDHNGWSVELTSPVLFRRTALTNKLPMPSTDGNLDELRSFVNVNDATWPLLRGWLVAALFPDVPHAVLLLGGEQGTGKSTAARILSMLIDPSPAPLRSEPKDIDSWATAACGSWLVNLDNISSIPAWLSDCLCKAVTGDGIVRRKLYTDSDLSVLSFKRVVCLTSIDAGSLRGDLADRLVLVDLETISDGRRRTDAELAAKFEAAHSMLFGGLLREMHRVMQALPDVELTEYPRMADFARILAAMDLSDGIAPTDPSSSLYRYLNQRGRLANEVIESDALAMAIGDLVTPGQIWTGSATDLLNAVTPEKPPKGWPKNAKALGGRLKRLTPALAQVGIYVEHDKSTDSSRKRIVTITKEEA